LGRKLETVLRIALSFLFGSETADIVIVTAKPMLLAVGGRDGNRSRCSSRQRR
jgi:hypothetical protein